MNYEPDHPLYGRTDEWIADHAIAATLIDIPNITELTTCVLAHEYKRLKAEHGDMKDHAKWYNIVCFASREIGESSAASEERRDLPARVREIKKRAEVAELDRYDLRCKLDRAEPLCATLDEVVIGLGMKHGELIANAPAFARKLREERDELKAANETKREAIINRNELIAELKSTHPPEDWLTRAIATAGAPEGSDWAGLLEFIDAIAKQAASSSKAHTRARIRIEEHEDMLSSIYDELPGFDDDNVWASDKLDGEVRKLRERAEFAEAERTRKGNEYTDEIAKSHLKCLEWRERADAATKDSEESEEYLCEWRDALAPFVTGTNDIDDLTPGMLSHVFAKEVSARKAAEDKVAGLKFEITQHVSGAKAMLKSETVEREKWQEISHRDYNGRCNKYRERAEAAEMALETKSDELGAMLSNAKQEVRTSSHQIKALEAQTIELAQERDRARHQLKWLEAEHSRVVQKELDANKVKWQVWVNGSDADATTPPLDRIAADVSRIVAALEGKTSA